jgi:hypothetical protein
MKSVFNYLVADEQTVYAEATTRQEARTFLKEVKSSGNKDVKIFREEYVKISERQVR